jgi:hypothetical protein
MTWHGTPAARSTAVRAAGRMSASTEMIEHQLRKAPIPVDMYSRWPQLRRPMLILIVSLLMAAAAVGLR